MTHTSHILLRVVTSDDGASCGTKCPQRNTPEDTLCMAFRTYGMPTNIKRGRAPACISAEQAVRRLSPDPIPAT